MSKKYLEQSWISPKVEQKNSPSHGLGLFAKKTIKVGEVVVIWGGNFMNEAGAKQAKQKGKAIQQINENVWDVFDYDTRNDDPSYNHNHSCDPNTWMQDDVTIIARRNIYKGEELTIDYAMLVIDDSWTMPEVCKCGSKFCRHKITGLDWQIKYLQDRYKNHFSPFINARIKKQKTNLSKRTVRAKK